MAPHLASGPTAPFVECPAIGADSSCGVLVQITNSGLNVYSDPSQGPYDGGDDTLTGVINSSSHTVSTLTLSSDTNLFGFDGDGICTSTYAGWSGYSGCPYGSTDYEGPNTSFSNINFNGSGGVVNFTGGLAPGASAYFALEEALTSAVVTAGGPSISEQGGAPNLSENPTTCSSGNPVNCSTGDFWHQFTDFNIPGRGVGLNFTRTYNSANASTTGPLGYGWTEGYNMSLATDSSGNVTITQEDGSTVTFTPNGSGGFNAPPRVLATLASDGSGGYTFTRFSNHVQYGFSSTGQLVSETDPNGYETTLQYSSGQLSSVTDPAGRTFTFAYSGSHIASVADPLGRVETFAYDGSGNLTTATDPLGHAWSFTYDSNHLMLTMTDPNGGVLTNTYDANNRVTRQVDPAGLVTTWSYSGDNASPAGGVTTMTDPHGNVTDYDYTNLELMAVTHAAGTPQAATTQYSYDPATLGVTSVTDPAGHTTTSTYDSHGNLLSRTDALSNTTYYGYNSLDEVTSITSPLGENTYNSYDGNGNLTGTTDPLGNATTYTYGDSNHPGDLTSVTDPDGRVTDFTYDSNGDVISRTLHPSSGENDTTVYGYDADGERTCTVSADAQAASSACPAGNNAPASGVSTSSYDLDGRVIKSIDGNGGVTNYQYDPNGNRSQVTDPDGHITLSTYDPDDRVLTVEKGADGANPSTTTNAYDLPAGSGVCSGLAAASYCTTSTDPNGNATIDYYDNLDQLVQEVRPGGHSLSFTYDPAGNQLTITNSAGQVTTDGYDSANRLTSVSYSDGVTPNVTYSYDADGHRASMTDGTGTTVYNYDADGRLTLRQDGAGSQVTYGYDGAGNVTSLTSGHTVQRAYDGAGRLISVTDWHGNATSFSYDPNGSLTTTSYPNGDDVTSTYDGNQQLLTTKAVKHSDSSLLAGLNYTRDADGLITQEADSGAPSGTTNYAYNAQTELTNAGSASYSYDVAGNPTQLGAANQQFNSADELLSATGGTGATTYSYDPNGDRITTARPDGSTDNYSYDQVGRLLSVTANQATQPTNPGPPSNPGNGGGPPPSTPAPIVTAVSPSSGPSGGGTTVTISGSNFTGASAVSFGGSAATNFQVTSDSSITASAPAGSGPVDITVTAPGGTSATSSADRFTYLGPPTVTAVSPTVGPTHGGTTVTISGSGFTGATGVNFGPNAASHVTINSDTSLTVTSPAGHGTVDVTVVTPNGTSATTSADHFRYVSGPVVTKVSPAYGTASGGNTVTITGSGFTGVDAVWFGHTITHRFTVLSGNSIRAMAPAGHGRVDIRVGTGAGMSPMIKADQFTYLSGLPVVTRLSPAHGLRGGGTQVTITGRHFAAASVVRFGHKAASFDLKSGHELVAMSPAGKGTVNVTVTTPTGTSRHNSVDQFTYRKPAPAHKHGAARHAHAVIAHVVANPPLATYTYDGDGLRVSKTVGATTVDFVWDVTTAVPELVSDGTNTYIYGPGGSVIEQVNIADGVSASYYFTDAIGSTRALLQSDGTVGATYTYDAYGNLTHKTGSADTPVRFAGGFNDVETGLYYLTHRYYDPVTAQWLTVDPAYQVTHSAYGYAADDPVNSVDPSGLFCVLGHNPNGSCRGSNVGNDLHAISTGAAVVGIGAGLVVIGATTFGAGDAVIAGALAVGGAATVVGTAADTGTAGLDCTKLGWNSRQCKGDIGGVVLDVATAGAGSKLKGVAQGIYSVGAGVLGLGYGYGVGKWANSGSSSAGAGGGPSCAQWSTLLQGGPSAQFLQPAASP